MRCQAGDVPTTDYHGKFIKGYNDGLPLVTREIKKTGIVHLTNIMVKNFRNMFPEKVPGTNFRSIALVR